MTWDDLQFWDSEEWRTVEERLDEFDRKGIQYNPKREDLFAALDACPFEGCKICILGQDPYPDASFATGIAFSIPADKKEFPPTLINIFKEYAEDLHHPFPRDGDLSPWAKQGVLLWNVVPTCATDKAGSHQKWTEWSFLTQEIVRQLAHRKILIIALGGIARYYVEHLLASDESGKNVTEVISLAHPSPLAFRAKAPFHGSRLFSTINAKLTAQKKQAIDWRLP